MRISSRFEPYIDDLPHVATTSKIRSQYRKWGSVYARIVDRNYSHTTRYSQAEQSNRVKIRQEVDALEYLQNLRKSQQIFALCLIDPVGTNFDCLHMWMMGQAARSVSVRWEDIHLQPPSILHLQIYHSPKFAGRRSGCGWDQSVRRQSLHTTI